MGIFELEWSSRVGSLDKFSRLGVSISELSPLSMTVKSAIGIDEPDRLMCFGVWARRRRIVLPNWLVVGAKVIFVVGDRGDSTTLRGVTDVATDKSDSSSDDETSTVKLPSAGGWMESSVVLAVNSRQVCVETSDASSDESRTVIMLSLEKLHKLSTLSVESSFRSLVSKYWSRLHSCLSGNSGNGLVMGGGIGVSWRGSIIQKRRQRQFWMMFTKILITLMRRHTHL